MAGSLSYNDGNGVPCAGLQFHSRQQPKPYEEEGEVPIELAADLVT